MHAYKIAHRGSLLGALPSLLGFVPHESIVVLLLAGAQVDRCVRLDVTDVIDPHDLIATQARQPGITGAIVIAVADRCHDAALGHAARFVVDIAFAGIDDIQVLAVRTIVAGGTWTDMISGETGVVDDPRDSAVTAAHIAQGRVIAASRDEIDARYKPAPDPVDPASVPDHRFIGDALTALQTAAAGRAEPADELIAAAAGLATHSVGVRDLMLSIGADSVDASLAAAALFTRISARTRAEARAELLTIAGTFAYAGGDAPAARSAFDAATATGYWPGRLHDLVTVALDHGVPPDRIRELLTTSAEPPPGSAPATRTSTGIE